MSQEVPAVYQGEQDLVLSRAPDIVLEEARKAAVALKGVVSAKEKKVMIRGEQYLEFEDWQTVGRFYGLSAKVVWSRPVDENCIPIREENPMPPAGFEARAVVINTSGHEISAAEATCMYSEEHWSGRPMFQVRSMAQTRACAKAFRNVLAWVIVLAGYRPTPAEEMLGDEGSRKDPSRTISEGQTKLVYVLLKKLGITISSDQKAKVCKLIGRQVEHLSEVTFEEASRTIDALQEEIKSKGGTP